MDNYEKHDIAVLLDVSAIMYRAFYGNKNFTNNGEPVGAVYGFTNSLISIIKEFNPTYIVAAMDVKRDSLQRSHQFKEYKSQRKPMPEELVVQIPKIEKVLDCFNIKRYKIDGYEADDILGTIAHKFSNLNIRSFVLTGDKDLSQIIDNNVSIALLGKGENGDKFKIIKNDKDVIEYLGVTSKQIPDLFGLIGDSSDGIPGVRKIGPKKAIPLINRFGSLENIYHNIEEISMMEGIGKTLITNIIEDKDIAFISKQLAIIDTNVPIDFNLDSLKYSLDKDNLYNLFISLGFNSLIKRLNLKQTNAIEELKIRNLKAKIYQEAGESFNINSTKSIVEILFKLNLIYNYNLESSIDEMLDNLSKDGCKLADYIIEYKKIS